VCFVARFKSRWLHYHPTITQTFEELREIEDKLQCQEAMLISLEGTAQDREESETEIALLTGKLATTQDEIFGHVVEVNALSTLWSGRAIKILD
jgi:hypothetical protein